MNRLARSEGQWIWLHQHHGTTKVEIKTHETRFSTIVRPPAAQLEPPEKKFVQINKRNNNYGRQ